MNESIKPYGFDEEATYMIQTLKRGRWVVRGRGKLTLERALKWEKIANEAPHRMRIRLRLPNGVWFSAWCASTPYLALILIIRYLTAKAKVKKNDKSLVKSLAVNLITRNPPAPSKDYDVEELKHKARQSLSTLVQIGYCNRCGWFTQQTLHSNTRPTAQCSKCHRELRGLGSNGRSTGGIGDSRVRLRITGKRYSQDDLRALYLENGGVIDRSFN